MKPPTVNHATKVREWLTSLAALTMASVSRTELKARLDGYTQFLAKEFQPAAFTSDSLRHVARACVKGWPTYGELCTALSEWWRDNQPYVPALPPPTMPWQPTVPQPRTPPTDEEREAVRVAAAAAIASLRSSAQPKDDYREQPAARCLSPGILDAINPLPNGRKRVG